MRLELFCLVFFFFKQKTAYDMRISDWSSDVCSSDLAIFQAGIEHGYREFIARVSEARKLTPERVDEIAQGRVWDGGTARQLKLVDRFGDLNDAIAEAARRAKLDPAKVHPVFLEKKPSWIATLAAQFARKQRNDDADAAGDVFSRIARDRRAEIGRAHV